MKNVNKHEEKIGRGRRRREIEYEISDDEMAEIR